MASEPFGPVRVHLKVWGSVNNPPLLLVHGLMTSNYSWRCFAPLLAPHFRVIAPSLPGSGESTMVTDRPYKASSFARWIVELVTALNIRGCAAIGNSLGGYLSMRAVLEDPSLFRRLVNLHSPGIPEPRLYALNAALAIPGLRSALAWWIRRSPLKWAHANVHYYDESLKSLEEAHAYGDPLSSKEGSLAFAKILGEVLEIGEMKQFIQALQKQPFPIPLLLLYARRDPMVPPRIGPKLSALVPDAPLVWIEESSHFAHVDTPQKVADLVLPFLTSP